MIYLPSAVFIAKRPSKTLKQIIEMKHNKVKTPNWQLESNQLAIYKCGVERELGTSPPCRESSALTTRRATLCSPFSFINDFVAC